MEYRIFKLRFLTATHFGRGGLTKAKGTLYADTIFSALCIEASKLGKLEHLLDAVDKGDLIISDGLPYIGSIYYIPKPLTRVEFEQDGDSRVKKAVKNLEYISVDDLDSYLSGKLNIEEASRTFHDCFGRKALIEKASVHDIGDAEPYAVEVYLYEDDSGLYMCAGYNGESVLELITELMESLSYSGIGGKRSSGYGRFTLIHGSMNQELLDRLTSDHYQEYETLSVSLPADEEMGEVIPDATYRLIKRSGFISSDHYSNTHRKKKDCFMMEAGAVVHSKYHGCVMDVSNGGNHPVYRYGKALLLGVR